MPLDDGTLDFWSGNAGFRPDPSSPEVTKHAKNCFRATPKQGGAHDLNAGCVSDRAGREGTGMIFREVNLHPAVQSVEFKRLLRVPADYAFAGPLATHAEWVRTWFAAHGRPWVCAREVNSCEVLDGMVRLGGVTVFSRELARRFRHARTAIVVAASAGAEAEAEAASRLADDEPDRYYFMESYASAIVEALIGEARARLCAWADAQVRVLLPHYSPGYHGWSVADQAKVFSLLASDAGLPGPLAVMESGMLLPKKSQLAVFAVAQAVDATGEDADLVPCKYCPHLRCDFRREPCELAS